MAKELVRGQKVRFAEFTSSLDVLVETQLLLPNLGEIDIACFGVDEQNRLADDRYFVFYNQVSSPDGAIRKIEIAGPAQARFAVNLAKLPPHISRLAFTASIDGSGVMHQLQPGYFRVLGQRQEEFCRFTFSGGDFGTEKAIILAEFYRKDGWRLAAVGQGFAGGLSALLTHYGGVEIAEASAEAPVRAPAPSRSLLDLFVKPTLHNISDDKARNRVSSGRP